MNVLTIGGAMVDTVAVIDDALIERISMSNAGKSFLLLEQGAKTEVLGISTHCGGGGVNSAVAFARLGFNVTTCVKLGRDERSLMIESVLSREGVSHRWVRKSEAAPTGASTVVSAHDRNAAIFTFRGANSLLCNEDFVPEMFEVDVVYVAPLSGASADVFPDLVKYAKQSEALLVVNPGIRHITSRSIALRRCLQDIDILAVNKLEAEALIGQAVVEMSMSDAPSERATAADILRFSSAAKSAAPGAASVALASGLLRLGCQKVLLTDGRHGACVATKDEIIFEPAQKVIVAGTAGAGDAIASTFAAWTLAGEKAAAALKAATVNAGEVVKVADAQSGLLRADELRSRLGS
ncbi:MAG: carbohydrate kinase family protein [Hyphomicrobium sp.]